MSFKLGTSCAHLSMNGQYLYNDGVQPCHPMVKLTEAINSETKISSAAHLAKLMSFKLGTSCAHLSMNGQDLYNDGVQQTLPSPGKINGGYKFRDKKYPVLHIWPN
ncbi:hypothetical protein CEXT_740541 [Caerostris extrusa]|uniref:Uncharacterized protein n=1 Tax=Caerostris extrusa TaxID=172846 RepID=A0AAV4YDD4_CAEEX|nr:hypothetical protein CEXT_740541 [Caerostris extrusa]